MDHLQHKDKYQLELKEQEFSNQHQILILFFFYFKNCKR
jgi:hypothetical protein